MALLEARTLQLGEALFDIQPGKDIRIRLRLGNASTEIPYRELFSMMFAISGPDEQEQLMPVRKTEVMHFTKKHVVKLKKDMKAGALMHVTCHQSVPLTVVEGLKGLAKEDARPKGIPIIGG